MQDNVANPQPQPYSYPAQQEMPPADTIYPKKAITKKMLLFISVLLLVFVAGGSYLFYQKIYLAPEKVLARSASNFSKISGYEYNGYLTINIDMPEDRAELVGFTRIGGKFIGKTDMTDRELIKNSMNIAVTAGITRVLDLDMITVGETSFLKVNGLDFLGSNDISALAGNWYRLDSKEIEGDFGITAASKPEMELTTEKKEAVEELMRKYPIIAVKKELPDEKLNGIPMHHYAFDVNKENLTNLITEIESVITGVGVGSATKELSQDNLNNIEFKNGELWIGKKDELPYKVILGIIYTDPGVEDFKLGADVEFNFTNYNNKDIVVTEPEGAIGLSELINSYFGMMGNSQDSQFAQARDSQRQADLYSIANAIYLYAAEHDGNLPDHESFPTVPTCIGTRTNCLNLEKSLVPDHLSTIPYDPSWGTKEFTGYTIRLTNQGRIELTATSEVDPGKSITVER